MYFVSDKFADAIGMIKSGGVRINCLDKSGMNYLDQACFKGNEELIEFLIENGANVDNRAHDQGYTSLMFAAIGGKLIRNIRKSTEYWAEWSWEKKL